MKGKRLIFISRIHRDGKGVTDLSKKDMSYMDDEKLTMNRLSITHDTYIACAFNSFVVKKTC